ncbi:MAG: NAD(P)/FAD-dependent oxidoreductase [Candidatus Omnitrophica bacterium]|nr:NAD(P)/FAD-dependent oxidoreductase [Candidatus Omnitrophota bacterium]MCF7894134.1 NAD(P)/FAD-dependent oxidoreductase [Candidatus Omnitrophota bacterium]
MNTEINKLTVIGAGVAGSSFLRTIKRGKQKIDISLIDKNNFYFPKNQTSKDPVDLNQVRKNEQLAKEVGADFICAEVKKISEKRKKIYLDDSKELEFENLIVASGVSNEKVDIKGTKKEGFFYLSEINPFLLKVLLQIHDEAVLSVSSLEGIKFSLLLNSLKKEVRVIAPSLEFLGQAQDKIVNILEKKGVILYLGYHLKEVIGEKNVKAVKIVKNSEDSFLEDQADSSMKVFSSQLVFIDSSLKPNLKFLGELETNLEKKSFLTKYGQIYIIGDAGSLKIKDQKCYRDNSLRAKEEGIALAKYFLGSEVSEFELRDQKDLIKQEIQDISDKEGKLWQNGLV